MSEENVQVERPLPASEWPDFFMAQDLVKLTSGIIGRPRAYEIVKEIGFKLGRGYGISKVDFFEWFLGPDNSFVWEMKQGEDRWEKGGKRNTD